MSSDESAGGSSLLKVVGTLTAFITAIAGLIGVLHQTGMLGTKSPDLTPAPAVHSEAAITSAPPEPARTVASTPREAQVSSQEPVAPARSTRNAPVSTRSRPVESAEATDVDEPPPPRRDTVATIAGTWMEPGGGMVIINQEGHDITMRIPTVEQAGLAMGIQPALTMLTGAIQRDDEGTQVTASNSLMQMRAQYRLSADGRRLDGMVTNQYGSLASILVKQ